MNNELPFDFESEDFWKTTIKKAVAKRLIKRDHTYCQMIADICELSEDEIKELFNLNRTYLRHYEDDKRQNYLTYYVINKYEDWQCKRIIDLNLIDVYEICNGRVQAYQLYIENYAESQIFENGVKIAKNLALIKMTDLNYTSDEISEILGDTNTEFLNNRDHRIRNNVFDKMENHFMNLGIQRERMDILINLLKFENNPENASLITGMELSEVEKIINDHEIFKSETTVLDNDKLSLEMKRIDLEILIEAIVIDGMYDCQIKDYAKLSGLDCETMKRIYELNNNYQPGLCEFLNECTFKLMEWTLDYDEIEEICGRSIYNTATEEYCYKAYKKHLTNEVLGDIL